MTDLRAIASAMGGEVRGNVASFPTPGHSAKDRGSWASIVPDAPDGVLISSRNGGDPLAIKDSLRAKGVLPDRQRIERNRDVGAWEYQDRDGVTLYRKVRMALASGGKSYRFEHPDGRGGWAPKRGDADPMPYRLPDLAVADPTAIVFMAEGEKQADKLASWGLVATSSKDWRREFASCVAGRNVVILPDNDPEGQRTAADAKAKVEAAGARAFTVELPDLPPKGDVMDWSGTAGELRALVEREMAKPGQNVQVSGGRKYQTIDAAALDAMEFAAIKYIVPGILPEGLALLAGKPKFGKSYMALGLGIAVASGGLAFGSIPCEAGDVLYAALEDNNRRLQARLRTMLPYGMEKPKRLHIATDWRRIGDGGVEDIEDWLDEHPGARLVMLDTLARIKPKSDGRGTLYDDDHSAIRPLQELAGRRGIAIVVIHHVRKSEADDVFDTISGSNGLMGVADTMLVASRRGDLTVLSGKGRDIEDYEKALTRDAVGGWTISGDAGELAKTNERQAILDVLAGSQEAMTPSEVATHLGKKRDNVNHLLSRMVSEGKVQRTKGRYSPFTPFTHSLPDDEPASERPASVHSFTPQPPPSVGIVNGVNGVNGVSDPFDPRTWEDE